MQLRDLAPFAHGHVLRVLAARRIGPPAGAGQYFLLDTGTLCVLGYYRDSPRCQCVKRRPCRADYRISTMNDAAILS